PGSQNEGALIFQTDDPSESDEFDLKVEIKGTDFNKMIDSNPFYPKFAFLLPEEFQLNKEGRLDIESGYIRAQARMDYTFTFDQEDE
ncbi:MAG: hypothetical protein LC641_12090, partial [Spirochaeta sp.]|nr:hypothetical protein [Spirochaeta sp.]